MRSEVGRGREGIVGRGTSAPGARVAALVLALGASPASGSAATQEPDTTGTGWFLTRLDLDVGVDPEAARLTLAGDLVLGLEGHERSRRLTLVVNSRDSIVTFDAASTDRGVVTELNARIPGRPSARATIIDFPDDIPARGDLVRVRVHASSRKNALQFTLAEDIALASWTTAWYPVPLPQRGESLGPVARAPGETRFDLPAGWRVLSNGVRVESRRADGRTRETWAADRPLARSFTAGPYGVTRKDGDGRGVELFLLTVEETVARIQARALAGVIAALERRFGPYPTGGYAIAEVPAWVPGFLASSEQGFMMAKPATFDVPGGNIPLFAHEAAHGYWGNRVVSHGPGSSFLSESLAQYGAVIALEEILGPQAALDFLKFSREGYPPLQSARGYFEVIRRGADSVAITDLQALDGIAKRIVVDSKGTWVLHMLRGLVGDGRFFTTLRDYLREHSDGSSTLDTFRRAFRRAAPDLDVEGFFAQWLDRTGAPRFDIRWEPVGDEVEVVVKQLQGGDPFSLTLDLRVEDRGGGAAVHEARIESRREVFRLPAPRGVAGVTLDPEFEVLRWDESYRMEDR